MTFTVAVSSAGRRVALLRAFRSAIASAGVPGRVLAFDINPDSAAFVDADAGFIVPHCQDPAFVPQVVDLCAREHVDLVVPTIDTELPAYATHQAQFGEVSTRVVISSAETIEICADKRLTHAFLLEKGLPTVRQANLDDGADTDVGLPAIVKPARGSSSVGVRVVTRAAELRTPAGETGLIVQSIAPGVEHTIDVYIDASGIPRCAVPRRRIEVRAGEVSKARTVRRRDLIELAHDVARSLPGARGVITIQVFLDEATGELNVIEINPRFGGGYPLALAAGADFPRWLVEETLGRRAEINAEAWTDGLLMLRYDDAVFVRGEVAPPA